VILVNYAICNLTFLLFFLVYLKANLMTLAIDAFDASNGIFIFIDDFLSESLVIENILLVFHYILYFFNNWTYWNIFRHLALKINVVVNVRH